MLIKEYRICMPMPAEEYRIGQLYMIMKKSREESEGVESGVEIIKNEPYADGPGGKGGQYTFKIYHIGKHLPPWLRSLFPKAALSVYEEAWNAYPYTLTRFRTPFIEKFQLDIESKYLNDSGSSENVFNLSEEELRQRNVVYIDIVKDSVSDYNESEDPKLFRSVKSGRGPLDENWRAEYAEAQRYYGKNSTKHIMCVYKLCRVEFRYWGMQTRAENFICELGLRKTLVRAHRQAWCWQDEYFDLTIEDIRRLEQEVQAMLATKMKQRIEESSTPSSSAAAVETLKNDDTLDSSESPVINIGRTSVSSCEDLSKATRSWSVDEEFFDAEEDLSSTIEVKVKSDSQLDSLQPHDSEQPSVLFIVMVTQNNESNGSHEQSDDDITAEMAFSTLKSTLSTTASKFGIDLDSRLQLDLFKCPNLVATVEELLSAYIPKQRKPNPSNYWRKSPMLTTASQLLLLSSDAAAKQLEDAVKTLTRFVSQTVVERFGETASQQRPVEVCFLADGNASFVLYEALVRWPSSVVESSLSLPNSRSPFVAKQCFLLGSPLGLILAHRFKCVFQCEVMIPSCAQVYNIFYDADPLASRIEPLLAPCLAAVAPVELPRWFSWSWSHQHYFVADVMSKLNEDSEHVPNSGFSYDDCESVLASFWGAKRIDYSLACSIPSTERRASIFHNMPHDCFVTLLQGSYWENRDVAAFLLQELLTSDVIKQSPPVITIGSKLGRSSPRKVIVFEKWLRPHRLFKLKRPEPNHHGSDILVSFSSNDDVRLAARMAYGTMDMIELNGERVDCHVENNGSWHYVGTQITDESGRVSFSLSRAQHRHVLTQGIHRVLMVVRGDHSMASLTLGVLPRHSRVAVFSIDGSFSASLSLSGSNPRLQPGCVDVVRHWAHAGYVVFYVSSRPDAQQNQVVNWLARHRFPVGFTTFPSCGISSEPFRAKATYLRQVITEAELDVAAAYGSAKDISVYLNAGIDPEHVFITGRPKHYSAGVRWLTEGYVEHLRWLVTNEYASFVSVQQWLFLRQWWTALTAYSINVSDMTTSNTSPTSSPTFEISSTFSSLPADGKPATAGADGHVLVMPPSLPSARCLATAASRGHLIAVTRNTNHTVISDLEALETDD